MPREEGVIRLPDAWVLGLYARGLNQDLVSHAVVMAINRASI
jgi:hypothetical protein